ncbi:hypothetical protein HDV00_006053 [Rhizophlyctis rosea]|nr:hypothetical protein HDV00_006053 [Rhizophlyctis rosea]
MEDVFAKLAISGGKLRPGSPALGGTTDCRELYSYVLQFPATMVGKAAFSMATNMAIKQVSAYVSTRATSITSTPSKPSAQEPEPQTLTKKLQTLQRTLTHRLAVVAPAIDLCSVVAARGGSAGVEAVLQLGQKVQKKLDHLGNRISSTLQEGDVGNSVTEELVKDVQEVLEEVEGLVPLLQLTLQTSGAYMGAKMPAGIGPGRLMRASAALVKSREELEKSGRKSAIRVGEDFGIKFYLLFTGSSRKSGVDWTWKEEFAKGVAKVERVSSTGGDEQEILYDLKIVEDLNDGRYHEETEGQPLPADKLFPGRERTIQVTDIKRMYYAVAGSLLNIEESRSPVLVIKVVHEREEDHQDDTEGGESPFRESSGSYAPEWFALESYSVEEDDDEGNVSGDSDSDDDEAQPQTASHSPPPPSPPTSQSASHLSLLEHILRLASLEMCEQKSHLDIPDDKINLYLANEAKGGNSAGVAGGAREGSGYVPLHSVGRTRKGGSGSRTGLDTPSGGKGGKKFSDRLTEVDG